MIKFFRKIFSKGNDVEKSINIIDDFINCLNSEEYKKAISISNSLNLSYPEFDSDILSIKKAIQNKDFGNSKILAKAFKKKLTSDKNQKSFSDDGMLNETIFFEDLVNRGMISSIENQNLPYPNSDEEWCIFHFNESKFYKKLKQLDNVELHLVKAINFNKSHFDSASALTVLYKESGNFEKALTVIDNYLPNSQKVKKKYFLYYRAEILYNMGKIKESRIQLDSIIAHFPKYNDARFLRLIIYSSTSDVYKCIEELEILKSTDTNYLFTRADGIMYLAILDNNLNSSERIELLKKSVALDPTWEDSNFNLGVFLIKKSSFSEALNHFLVAHQQSPKNIQYIELIVDCMIKIKHQQLNIFLDKGIILGSKYCLKLKSTTANRVDGSARN